MKKKEVVCKDCRHPLGWHGDRAVSGCDGGWNRVHSVSRPRTKDDDGVAICSCFGWR